MTDGTRPVLLLPGPSSTKAATELFGDAYECASWATGDYFGPDAQSSRALTNGALAALEGRRVDVWQAPGFAAHIDCAGVVQDLLKYQCLVRVIALNEGDAMDPFAARTAGLDKWALLTWAREHIQPAADFLMHAEAVAARELMKATPTAEPEAPPKRVRKGRPRRKADGSPPEGVTQIEQHEPPATVDSMPSAFISWERLGLDCNQNGTPHPHLANVQRVLAGHPELSGRIWFDEFHGKIFQTLFQEGAAEWLDFHDTRMTIWLQSQLRLHKIGHQIVQRAVDAFARLNTRNEVREWMDGLSWDGTERLATLMADGFGAEQNDYTAAVGRCWMVSMVARTYEPGCKVDTMPVFEGAQGLRKSSALSIIGGKWFAEMHEDITSKDFLQSLPGKLLIEISELHAFRRAEVNRIKGIISCATDRYRESYGRRAGDHPRRGVFAGSVNRDDWVEDDTGARRFWPIACGGINSDYLRSTREQLFAEARALYERVPRGTSAVDRIAAGAAWWDIDEVLAKQEQDQRREADEWTDAVLYYASQYPEVRVGDVLGTVLDIPLAERDKAAQMRVASIFRLAGYRRKTVWRGGQMVKIWLTIKR